MPTASTVQLHPPSDWDEFENICADLFTLEWKYPGLVRYGRKGQRQNGVDIYGQQDGENAGVQCKGKRVWPPTQLTTSDIDEEVKKAKKFRPKLKELIFATIADDDVHIQDHVNAISERHSKRDLFSVRVYGWGELTRRIRRHPSILNTHFNTYTVPLLRDEMRETAEHVIERLTEVITTKAALAEGPLQAGTDADTFQPGIVDALERDFSQRYRRALHRSFFPEIKTNEFYPLAQVILDGAASTVSPALRRRVLLMAARSMAARSDLELSERLLTAAIQLEGPDSELPAKARLREARGETDEAIRTLRDATDEASRSMLLSIIARTKGEDAALAWLKERDLSVADLTANGIVALSQIHLRRNDLEAAKQALAILSDQQFADCPYLYLLRGGIRFASLLPKPEQPMVLGGMPLDVRRARPIVPDAQLAAELDMATADLQRALPLAVGLSLSQGSQASRTYLIWCDLLHPGRHDAALAQLRSDMQEPTKALPLIQFALAYDPQFDSASIAAYLERRESLGGLNDDEVAARLAICLNKDDPQAVSEVIAKHRDQLETSFGKPVVLSLEIQALAKTGDATSARLLLDANRALFSAETIAGFETDIAKAEGADPFAEHLNLYQATKTTDALRALVGALVQRNDARGIVQYAEELYKRTDDPRDIALAAKAFADAGDNQNFVRLAEAFPFLQDYDAGLRRHYAWQLFRLGRLDDARAITDAFRQKSPSERDSNLEIALAIESGEWELLAQPLATILERAAELDGPTLIRAASLSQASGQGPLLDLVQAAIANAPDDPNVLLGAYTLYVEEGLEEDRPEAHDWFRRALTLSGPEGPVQRFELKELLAQQTEWNEFTRKVNEAIARGDMPMSVAGPGLRTSVLDVVLRNFVRNNALADARKVRSDTTQERKPRASSATSSSIRSGCFLASQ
jgi:hypothetical protein